MRIGIFDSGMGGLSVLHQARRMMPDAHFIYYADEAHVPYGEKTENEVREFVAEIIDFMLEKKVNAIVIACNTATSVADRAFRSRFPVPIIGMEPAVKTAVEQYGREGTRILAAATPITIAGKKLHTLLEQVDHRHIVDLVSLPGLVRFAEAGDFEASGVEAYLKEALAPFDLSQYSALVLGCTHFNYFKLRLGALFPRQISFVDGIEGVLRQLNRKIEGISAGMDPADIEYYFSGRPVTADEKQRIQRYLDQLERMAEIRHNM